MTNKTKILIVRITIPLLIIAGIVTLYFIKNTSGDGDDTLLNTQDEISSPSDVPDPLDNADFNLTATSVDIKELSKYGLPIIIDYGAEGCGPCQEMKPTLKKLNEKMYRKAFIKYVDVWEHPETVGNLPINLIPTQAFYNADGTPWVPSEKLQSLIGFNLYYDSETGEHILTLHISPLNESEMMAILVEMGVDAYD